MSNPVSIQCQKPELCGVKAHRPGTIAKCMKTGKPNASLGSARSQLTVTPGLSTPKMGGRNGEVARLHAMNPAYIIEQESRRELMHDPRVTQIETELADTPKSKGFMDDIRISQQEGAAIKEAATKWGFKEDESAEVIYAVQQIRRERLIQDDDLDPRINALAGDAQVFEIAKELNEAESEADEAEGVERMKARFAHLHVHEDDHDGLVEIVKHRVAFSEAHEEGLDTSASFQR